MALYEESYLLAFPPGHRLEKMNAVPLAETEGDDYIKRIHCEFPSNFMKLEVAKPYRHVRQRYSTEREDWVQSMVAAGLGLTLMPEFLPLVPGIVTRPIMDPEVTRTISMVTRAGRPHTEAVRLALRCARDMDWEKGHPPSAAA